MSTALHCDGPVWIPLVKFWVPLNKRVLLQMGGQRKLLAPAPNDYQMYLFENWVDYYLVQSLITSLTNFVQTIFYLVIADYTIFAAFI